MDLREPPSWLSKYSGQTFDGVGTWLLPNGIHSRRFRSLYTFTVESLLEQAILPVLSSSQAAMPIPQKVISSSFPHTQRYFFPAAATLPLNTGLLTSILT
jgi:hypothetical protein